MATRKVAGRLIVLEGPDGVGKSTLCRLLTEQLSIDGTEVLSLSFPGKQPGSLGELVYRVHHDQASLAVRGISELAKQALHIAAHVDAIQRQIIPALEKSQVVVLDRFWWSAWVYGLVGGCDRKKLRAFVDAERSTWGSFRPTLAVLLRRPEPIERNEPVAQWNALAKEYKRLASRERQKYSVVEIDNTSTPGMAVQAVLDALGPAKRKTQALRTGKEVSETRSKIGRSSAPSHILPLKPSVVFDTYWRFAAERQSIFFNRLEGKQQPWTTDPILSTYKFTNAYRASDRVSQYLISQVIYRPDLPSTADEVFFRIMLFKFFNKIETWRELEADVGPILYETYSFDRYAAVLSRSMAAGKAIYSAAYIMPSGGKSSGYERKHFYHLALIERMISDGVPRRLSDCRSMQQAFELLKTYPGIGDFLAYQYVIDINYSELTSFSESDFVVPGPGALDGMRKCFIDRGGLNEPELIKFMADRQEYEFERLGLSFRSLWGRSLQLIDCQNLFCEVDKYSRVRHPEIEGITGRSRIKQRLVPKSSLPSPWYPPKWRLNDEIAVFLGSSRFAADRLAAEGATKG